MFFLALYVQPANIVVQCFKVRPGSFDKKKVFLRKGTSMGSTQHPADGDTQPTLPGRGRLYPLVYRAGGRARAVCGYMGYVGIRFHRLEVLPLKKKEAKQKRSQGPVGWLLKFFMHSDVRDVHFQSHSAVELKSSCKYFYTEPDRAWTSIMKK